MISIVTASSSSGNNNNFNNYLIIGLLGLSYYVIYQNLKLSK